MGLMQQIKDAAQAKEKAEVMVAQLEANTKASMDAINEMISILKRIDENVVSIIDNQIELHKRIEVLENKNESNN